MRTHRIALSGLLVCLLLGSIAMLPSGCAGTRYQRSTGTYLDDQGITARVKTALFRDPLVSGFDVHVNTFRGDVQLSGYVDTPEQKERAAQVAREIPGVQLVTNNLEVKPPQAVGTTGSAVTSSSETVTQPASTPPPSAQPQNYAPVRTPGQPLGSTMAAGSTGTASTEPWRPRDRGSSAGNGSTVSSAGSSGQNTGTANAATETETSSRPAEPIQNVQIMVDNGQATLSGTVASDAQRQDLERRIREIPGIRSVNNQLNIANAR